MIRTFIFRDNFFQGFTVKLNIDNTYDQEKILNACILRLNIILEQHGLIYLTDVLKKKLFHIHDFNMEDIYNINEQTPIYICSCI